MKPTQQPARRQLLSWAIALPVIGTAGVIPGQPVPRETRPQDPPKIRPTAQPVRDVKDERVLAATEEAEARLRAAEANVKAARAEQKVAGILIEQAEAEAARAAELRGFCEKSRDRMVGLEKHNAVPHEIVDDKEALFREAQAAEQRATAKITSTRVSLQAAKAAVRAAEALRDIARIELRIATGGEAKAGMKEAQTQLREARLDQARYECDAARTEAARAEAELKAARTAVEYRTKHWEPLRRLLNPCHTPSRDLVDEMEQDLTEARAGEREAKVAYTLAGARLDAAEFRRDAAEAGAINAGSTSAKAR